MTFFKSKSFGCCSSTQEDDDEDKGISAEFVITRTTARLDSSTYHPPTQKRQDKGNFRFFEKVSFSQSQLVFCLSSEEEATSLHPNKPPKRFKVECTPHWAHTVGLTTSGFIISLAGANICIFKCHDYLGHRT